MSRLRQVPDRIIDNDIQNILDTYTKAYQDVAKKLKNNLDYDKNRGFSRVSMYSQFKQIEEVLGDLNISIATLVPEAIQRAIEGGYVESLFVMYMALDLKGSYAEAWKNIPFSSINREMAEQFAKDTMKDLLQATKNTEYAVKKLVQESFSKHLSIQALQNAGNKDMARVIMNDLVGKGLEKSITSNMIGIVDKAGRRWKVNTYVDMVVRTKFREAKVEGMKEYANLNDGKGDLARIPVNGAEDMCRHFEGMVISLTGATAGYRTYDELRATNQIYHPRCRHTPKPIYALEYLHEEELKDHKSSSRKADIILKDFER